MRNGAQPIRYIRFVVATGSTLDTAMAVSGDELRENPYDIGMKDWLLTDSDEERANLSTLLQEA